MESNKNLPKNFTSLSIAMISCIGFSHIMGFIVKVVFRIQLSPAEYGVFAYFVGFYPFFLILGHVYLEFPIVASVSEEPEDAASYLRKKRQLLSVVIVLGTVSATLYFFWTGIGTGLWLLSAYFSFIMLSAALSNVLLAFPRGKGLLKPTGLAWLTTGLFRSGLLFLFVAGIFLGASVEAASLVFALPWLTWPAIVVYFREWTRPTMPSKELVAPFLSNSIWALLVGLAIQIPLSVSLLFIKELHGFTEVGDFDIALISYSMFSIIVAGAVYVINAKARDLPNFPKFSQIALKQLALPILLWVLAIMLLSGPFESLVSNVLLQLGIPITIYWSVVVFLGFAVPVRILIEIVTAYLQGRSVFKPVGIITISCAIAGLPLLYLLIGLSPIIGGAIGVGVINILTLVILAGYALRRNSTPQLV